jgi:hypothetical protein
MLTESPIRQAIRGNQRPVEGIGRTMLTEYDRRGNQRQSEAIKGRRGERLHAHHVDRVRSAPIGEAAAAHLWGEDAVVSACMHTRQLEKPPPPTTERPMRGIV